MRLVIICLNLDLDRAALVERLFKVRRSVLVELLEVSQNDVSLLCLLRVYLTLVAHGARKVATLARLQ